MATINISQKKIEKSIFARNESIPTMLYTKTS